MATSLEHILQEIQALSLADRQRLCRLLAATVALPAAVTPATEATFHQQLMTAGLLREHTRPRAPQGSPTRPPRVTIQGKPLSVTVIEERR